MHHRCPHDRTCPTAHRLLALRPRTPSTVATRRSCSPRAGARRARSCWRAVADNRARRGGRVLRTCVPAARRRSARGLSSGTARILVAGLRGEPGRAGAATGNRAVSRSACWSWWQPPAARGRRPGHRLGRHRHRAGARTPALAGRRHRCLRPRRSRWRARNGERLAGGRVEWLAGDWYAPLDGRRFDALVSNPPYIAADDPGAWRRTACATNRARALTPGGDGLGAFHTLINGRRGTCTPAAGWSLEHGTAQGATLRAALVARGFTHVTSHRDLAGHERVSEGNGPIRNPKCHLVFETSLGNFEVELFEKEAPISAQEFPGVTSTTASSTASIFHRVIPGFMIQGGGFEPGMKQKKVKAPIKNEADQRPQEFARHARDGAHQRHQQRHRAVLRQPGRQRLPRSRRPGQLRLRGVRQGHLRHGRHRQDRQGGDHQSLRATRTCRPPT